MSRTCTTASLAAPWSHGLFLPRSVALKRGFAALFGPTSLFPTPGRHLDPHLILVSKAKPSLDRELKGLIAHEMAGSPIRKIMTNGSRDIEFKAFEVITGLFGLVWLLNAAVQARAWLFAPDGAAGANLLNAFTNAEAKAPAWLQPALTGALHGIEAVGPRTVAAGMVAIAVVLGFSLLTRRAVGAFAVVGVVYSLVCWVLLAALGFPYSNGQTDPGVFIPYAIAFLVVLSLYPPSGAAVHRKPWPNNPLWETSRLLFGLLWAFDAALKWLPAFLFHFSSQITSVIPGQPQWVADWLHFVAQVIAMVGPVPVAVIVALIETVIAVGLLSGRGLRLILPIGIAYSLAVWATAEAFGGPYSAAGTGVRGNVIGNAIIYLIPFFYLSAELYGRVLETPAG